MKPARVGLIIVGVLALLIGLVISFNTLTDDYASKSCEKAASDQPAFAQAQAKCGNVTTQCYKDSIIGLTPMSECESRKSFMKGQLVMGIVPSVFGVLLALVGLVIGRKKAIA